MLERWVAPLLMRLLGDYVKENCFDPGRVHLDVWSGYVVLEKLELRSDAFDKLNLPIALRRGYIGRLELAIPWGNPGTKPTVIKVDQIYLVLETIYEWDSLRSDKRKQYAMKRKLEAVEAARQRARIRANHREVVRRKRNEYRSSQQTIITQHSGISSTSDKNNNLSPSSSSADNAVTTETNHPSISTLHPDDPPINDEIDNMNINNDDDDDDNDDDDLYSELSDLDSEHSYLRNNSLSPLKNYQQSSLIMDTDNNALSSSSSSGNTSGVQAFLDSLLRKVIDNLQIHIRGVHIRWIDRVSDPLFPFAVGICAVALHVQSIGSNQHDSNNTVPNPSNNTKSTSSKRNLTNGKDSPSTSNSPHTSTTNGNKNKQAPTNTQSYNQSSSSSSTALITTQSPPVVVRKLVDIVHLSAYVQHRYSKYSHTTKVSTILPESVNHGLPSSSSSSLPSPSSSLSSPKVFVPSQLNGIDIDLCDSLSFVNAMETIIPRRFDTKPADLEIYFGIPSSPQTNSRNLVSPRESNDNHDKSIDDNRSVTPSVLTEAMASEAGLRSTSGLQAGARFNFARSIHDSSVLPRIRASSTFGPIASSSPLMSNISSSPSCNNRPSSSSSASVSPIATAYTSRPIYHHPMLRDVPSIQALPSHSFAKDFILLPANGQIHLSLAKVSNDLRVPQHDISIHIGALAFQIQSGQYRCAVAIATGFAAYYTRTKYEHLRPSQRLITNSSNGTGSITGSNNGIIHSKNPSRTYTNDTVMSSKSSSTQTSQSSTPFPQLNQDNASSSVRPSSQSTTTPLIRAVSSTSTRPSIPSTLMDPVRSRIARNWWRFAVIATLQNERNRRTYWRWQDITDHRIIRLTYIWLYKRSLEGTLPARSWSPKRIRSLEKLQSSRRSLFLEEEEQQHIHEETNWNQQQDYTLSTVTKDTYADNEETYHSVVRTPTGKRNNQTIKHKSSNCFLDTITDASIIKEILGTSLFRTKLKKWSKKYKIAYTKVITLSEYIDEINDEIGNILPMNENEGLKSNGDGNGISSGTNNNESSLPIPTNGNIQYTILKERLQQYTTTLEQTWEHLDDLLLPRNKVSSTVTGPSLGHRSFSSSSFDESHYPSGHYRQHIGIYTQLNEHELVLLRILEDRLSSSDLFLFRTLADHEIIAEKSSRQRYINEGLIPTVSSTFQHHSRNDSTSPTHSVITVGSLADVPYSRKSSKYFSKYKARSEKDNTVKITIPHADDEDGKSVLTDIENTEQDRSSVLSHTSEDSSLSSSSSSWSEEEEEEENNNRNRIESSTVPVSFEMKNQEMQNTDGDSFHSEENIDKIDPTGSDIDDNNTNTHDNDEPVPALKPSETTNNGVVGGMLGWLGLGWIWNSSGTTADNTTTATPSIANTDIDSSSAFRMTEAQRRELYSIIEYDPEMALRPYPVAYNRTLVHLHIDACTLTLVDDKLNHRNTGSSSVALTPSVNLRPLYHLYLEHMDIRTTARSTSHRLQCSLQNFAVYDLSATSAAVFTRIIGKRESLHEGSVILPNDNKDSKSLRRVTSIETTMDTTTKTTTGTSNSGTHRSINPKSISSKQIKKDTLRTTNTENTNEFTYSGDEEGEESQLDDRKVSDNNNEEDDAKSSSRLSEGMAMDPNVDDDKERSPVVNSVLLYFVFETFPQSSTSQSSDTNDEENAVSSLKLLKSKRIISGNAIRTFPSGTTQSVRSRNRNIGIRSSSGTVRSSNTKKSNSGGAVSVTNISSNHQRSPWTNGADAVVIIRLQPLEVTYNQLALSSLREFFSNPVESLQELPGGNALTNAAVHQLQDIRKRTIAALERAYRQGRVAIAVDARIASPVLILPLNVVQPRSIILVVDSGVLRIRSVKLQNKRSIGAAMAAVEASHTMKSNDKGTEPVKVISLPKFDESLPFLPALPNQTWSDNLFDTYVFQITSAQALLCKADTPWRKDIDRDLRGLSIIKKFSVRIETKLSIVPDDVTIPRVWLISELPALHLRLSHIQSMLLKDILTLYVEQRKNGKVTEPVESRAEKTVKNTDPGGIKSGIGTKLFSANPPAVPSSSSSSSSSSWLPSATFESFQPFRDVINFPSTGNKSGDLLSPPKLTNRKSLYNTATLNQSTSMHQNNLTIAHPNDEVSAEDYVTFRHLDNNAQVTLFPDTYNILESLGSAPRTVVSPGIHHNDSFIMDHPHINISDNGMLIYHHNPLWSNSMYEKQKKLRTSTVYPTMNNMSSHKGLGYVNSKYYSSRLPSRMHSPPPLALGEPVNHFPTDLPLEVSNGNETEANTSYHQTKDTTNNINRSNVLLFTPTSNFGSNQRFKTSQDHRSTGLFSEKSFVTARSFDGDIPLSDTQERNRAEEKSAEKVDTDFVSPVHNFHGFDSTTLSRSSVAENGLSIGEGTIKMERKTGFAPLTKVHGSATSASDSMGSHSVLPVSPSGIIGLAPRTPVHPPALSSPLLSPYPPTKLTPYASMLPVSALTFHATFLLASFTLELAHGERESLYLRWSPVWNPLTLTSAMGTDNTMGESTVPRPPMISLSSKHGEKDLITISSVGIRPVFIGGNGNRLTSIFDIRAFHIYDNMQPYGPLFGNLVSSLPRSHVYAPNHNRSNRSNEPFESVTNSFSNNLNNHEEGINNSNMEKDTIMNDETHEDMTDGRLLRIIVRRRVVVNPSSSSSSSSSSSYEKNIIPSAFSSSTESYPETNVDFAFSSIALSLNEATIVSVLRAFIRDERIDNNNNNNNGSITSSSPTGNSSSTTDNERKNHTVVPDQPTVPSSSPLLTSLFTGISSSLPSISVITDTFSFQGISRVNFRLLSFELALSVNGKHLAVAALTDSQISIRYASLLHKQLLGCSVSTVNDRTETRTVSSLSSEKHNYLITEVKSTSSTQIRGKLGNLRILDYWTINDHPSTVKSKVNDKDNKNRFESDTTMRGSTTEFQSGHHNYTYWKPGDASNNSLYSPVQYQSNVLSNAQQSSSFTTTTSFSNRSNLFSNPLVLPKPREIFGLQQHHQSMIIDHRSNPSESLVQFELLLAPVFQASSILYEGYDKRLYPKLDSTKNYGLSLSNGLPQGYIVTLNDILNSPLSNNGNVSSTTSVVIPRAQFISIKTQSVQCILDSSFFAAFPSYYATSPLALYSRGSPRGNSSSASLHPFPATTVDTTILPSMIRQSLQPSTNLLNHVSEALQQRVPSSLQSLTAFRYHIELQRPILILPRRWVDEQSTKNDNESDNTRPTKVTYHPLYPFFPSSLPVTDNKAESDNLLHIPRLREYIVFDLGQISVANTFNNKNNLPKIENGQSVTEKNIGLHSPTWNEDVHINVTSLHAQLTSTPHELRIVEPKAETVQNEAIDSSHTNGSPSKKIDEGVQKSSLSSSDLAVPLHFSKKIIRDVDISIHSSRPAPFTPELHLSASTFTQLSVALANGDFSRIPFVLSDLTTSIQIGPIEMDLADAYIPLLRAIWFENGRRLQRIFFGGSGDNNPNKPVTSTNSHTNLLIPTTVNSLNNRIRRSKIQLHITGLWLNIYRTKNWSIVKTTEGNIPVPDDQSTNESIITSLPIDLTELVSVHVEHVRLAVSEIQDDPRYTYLRQILNPGMDTVSGEPSGIKSGSIILGPLTVCDTRTDRKNVYGYVMMPRETNIAPSTTAIPLSISASTNNLVSLNNPVLAGIHTVPSSPFLRFHYVRDSRLVPSFRNSSSTTDKKDTNSSSTSEQICVLRIIAPRVLIIPEVLGSLLSWYNQVRTIVELDTLLRRPYYPGALHDYGDFILPVYKFVDANDDILRTTERVDDSVSLSTDLPSNNIEGISMAGKGIVVQSIDVSAKKVHNTVQATPFISKIVPDSSSIHDAKDRITFIIDFHNPEFWLFEDSSNVTSTVIVIQGTSIRGMVKLQRESVQHSYNYILRHTLDTMVKELLVQQQTSGTISSGNVTFPRSSSSSDHKTKGKWVPRSFELTLLRIEVLMQRPVISKGNRITRPRGSTIDTSLNGDYRYPSSKGISRSSSYNILSTIDHTHTSTTSRNSTPFRFVRSRSDSAGIHLTNHLRDGISSPNRDTLTTSAAFGTIEQLGHPSPFSRKTLPAIAIHSTSLNTTTNEDHLTITESVPNSPAPPPHIIFPSVSSAEVISNDNIVPSSSLSNRPRLPPRTWSNVSLTTFGSQMDHHGTIASVSSSNLPGFSPTIDVVPSLASNPRNNQPSIFDLSNENWIHQLSSLSQNRIVLVLPFSMKITGETYSLVPVPVTLNSHDIYQRRQAILKSKPTTGSTIRGVVLSSLAHLIDTYFTKQTPAIATVDTGTTNATTGTSITMSSLLPSTMKDTINLPDNPPEPETSSSIPPEVDSSLLNENSHPIYSDLVYGAKDSAQPSLYNSMDTDEIPLPPSLPASKDLSVSSTSSVVDLSDTELLQDIQKYNKEAAIYASTLICNTVVKLPTNVYDTLLMKVGPSIPSDSLVKDASLSSVMVDNAVRTPLPSQILALPVANISIAPITICMSQDEIQTISNIVDALRILPMIIRRNDDMHSSQDTTTGPQTDPATNESPDRLPSTKDNNNKSMVSPVEETNGTTAADTYQSSNESTYTFPMVPLPSILQKSMQFPLLPHPVCYAGKLQCTTLRMVIVVRNFMKSVHKRRLVRNFHPPSIGNEDNTDNGSFTIPSVTIDTELHDALKYPSTSSTVPLAWMDDEKYFHQTNLTVPLLRIVTEQCDSMICAAPALTTVQGKAVTSIDTANAYITRWEPIIEPWNVDASVSILRSAVTAIAAAAMASSTNSTGAADLSRAIMDENIALANNNIWYPDNLLRSIALTGLSTTRGKSARWYDFIGGGRNNKQEPTIINGTLRSVQSDGQTSRSYSNNVNQHHDEALDNLDSTGYITDADGQLLPIDIVFSSSAPLKINLTTAGLSTLSLLNVLMNKTEILVPKDEGITESFMNTPSSSSSSSNSTSIQPFYWIRNDTGCPVRYAVVTPPSSSTDTHVNPNMLVHTNSNDKGKLLSLSTTTRDTEYACGTFRSVPIRSSREYFTWPNERHFTIPKDPLSRNHASITSSSVSGLYISLLMDVSMLNIPYDASFLTSIDTPDTTSVVFPDQKEPPVASYRSITPLVIDTAVSNNDNEILPWNLYMTGYENIPSVISSLGKPLVHSSPLSYVRVEGTSVRLLRFDSILPSFLPTHLAYEICISKLGVRRARIRSTLIITNRLDIPYRFEIHLVPKIGSSSSSSVPSEPPTNPLHHHCLWSIILQPGQAVWVPAPMGIWLHQLYQSCSNSLYTLEYKLFLLIPPTVSPKNCSVGTNRQQSTSLSKGMGVKELYVNIPVDNLVPVYQKDSNSSKYISSEPKVSFPLQAMDRSISNLSMSTQGTVSWGKMAYQNARNFQLIDSSNCEPVPMGKIPLTDDRKVPLTSVHHPVFHSQRYMYPADNDSNTNNNLDTLETEELFDEPSSVATTIWPPFTVDPELPKNHHHYLACLSIEPYLVLVNRLPVGCDVQITKLTFENDTTVSVANHPVRESNANEIFKNTSVSSVASSNSIMKIDNEESINSSDSSSTDVDDETDRGFRSACNGRERTKHSQFYILSGYEHQLHHNFGTVPLSSLSVNNSFILRLRPNNMRGWSSGILFQYRQCNNDRVPRIDNIIPLHGTYLESTAQSSAVSSFDNSEQRTLLVWVKVHDSLLLNERIGMFITLNVNGISRIHIYSPLWIINRTGIPLLIDRIYNDLPVADANVSTISISPSTVQPPLLSHRFASRIAGQSNILEHFTDDIKYDRKPLMNKLSTTIRSIGSSSLYTTAILGASLNHHPLYSLRKPSPLPADKNDDGEMEPNNSTTNNGTKTNINRTIPKYPSVPPMKDHQINGIRSLLPLEDIAVTYSHPLYVGIEHNSDTLCIPNDFNEYVKTASDYELLTHSFSSKDASSVTFPVRNEPEWKLSFRAPGTVPSNAIFINTATMDKSHSILYNEAFTLYNSHVTNSPKYTFRMTITSSHGASGIRSFVDDFSSEISPRLANSSASMYSSYSASSASTLFTHSLSSTLRRSKHQLTSKMGASRPNLSSRTKRGSELPLLPTCYIATVTPAYVIHNCTPFTLALRVTGTNTSSYSNVSSSENVTGGTSPETLVHQAVTTGILTTNTYPTNETMSIPTNMNKINGSNHAPNRSQTAFENSNGSRLFIPDSGGTENIGKSIETLQIFADSGTETLNISTMSSITGNPRIILIQPGARIPLHVPEGMSIIHEGRIAILDYSTTKDVHSGVDTPLLSSTSYARILGSNENDYFVPKVWSGSFLITPEPLQSTQKYNEGHISTLTNSNNETVQITETLLRIPTVFSEVKKVLPDNLLDKFTFLRLFKSISHEWDLNGESNVAATDGIGSTLLTFTALETVSDSTVPVVPSVSPRVAIPKAPFMIINRTKETLSFQQHNAYLKRTSLVKPKFTSVEEQHEQYRKFLPSYLPSNRQQELLASLITPPVIDTEPEPLSSGSILPYTYYEPNGSKLIDLFLYSPVSDSENKHTLLSSSTSSLSSSTMERLNVVSHFLGTVDIERPGIYILHRHSLLDRSLNRIGMRIQSNNGAPPPSLSATASLPSSDPVLYPSSSIVNNDLDFVVQIILHSDGTRLIIIQTQDNPIGIPYYGVSVARKHSPSIHNLLSLCIQDRYNNPVQQYTFPSSSFSSSLSTERNGSIVHTSLTLAEQFLLSVIHQQFISRNHYNASFALFASNTYNSSQSPLLTLFTMRSRLRLNFHTLHIGCIVSNPNDILADNRRNEQYLLFGNNINKESFSKVTKSSFVAQCSGKQLFAATLSNIDIALTDLATPKSLFRTRTQQETNTVVSSDVISSNRGTKATNTSSFNNTVTKFSVYSSSSTPLVTGTPSRILRFAVQDFVIHKALNSHTYSIAVRPLPNSNNNSGNLTTMGITALTTVSKSSSLPSLAGVYVVRPYTMDLPNQGKSLTIDPFTWRHLGVPLTSLVHLHVSPLQLHCDKHTVQLSLLYSLYIRTIMKEINSSFDQYNNFSRKNSIKSRVLMDNASFVNYGVASSSAASSSNYSVSSSLWNGNAGKSSRNQYSINGNSKINFTQATDLSYDNSTGTTAIVPPAITIQKQRLLRSQAIRRGRKVVERKYQRSSLYPNYLSNEQTNTSTFSHESNQDRSMDTLSSSSVWERYIPTTISAFTVRHQHITSFTLDKIKLVLSWQRNNNDSNETASSSTGSVKLPPSVNHDVSITSSSLPSLLSSVEERYIQNTYTPLCSLLDNLPEGDNLPLRVPPIRIMDMLNDKNSSLFFYYLRMGGTSSTIGSSSLSSNILASHTAMIINPIDPAMKYPLIYSSIILAISRVWELPLLIKYGWKLFIATMEQNNNDDSDSNSNNDT